MPINNFYQNFKNNPNLDNFYKLFLFDKALAEKVYAQNPNRINRFGNSLELACQKKNLAFLTFLNQSVLDANNFEHVIKHNDQYYYNVLAFMWLEWPEGWEVIQNNKLWVDDKSAVSKIIEDSIQKVCHRNLSHDLDAEERHTKIIYNLLDYFILPNEINNPNGNIKKYSFYPSVDEMLNMAMDNLQAQSLKEILENDTPYSEKELLKALVKASFENIEDNQTISERERTNFINCYAVLKDKLLVCKHYSLADFVERVHTYKQENLGVIHYSVKLELVDEFSQQIQREVEEKELKENFSNQKAIKKNML